jgi:hypothetical protein
VAFLSLRSGHGGPRRVPSIAARVPVVPRQYTNACSGCRERGRGYSNLLIRSYWRVAAHVRKNCFDVHADGRKG